MSILKPRVIKRISICRRIIQPHFGYPAVIAQWVISPAQQARKISAPSSIRQPVGLWPIVNLNRARITAIPKTMPNPKTINIVTSISTNRVNDCGGASLAPPMFFIVFSLGVFDLNVRGIFAKNLRKGVQIEGHRADDDFPERCGGAGE